jgi:hypothetical protein
MPWDCLLLEVGWLAPLLPAVGPAWAAAGLRAAAAPHPLLAWALRWLLWRLVFGFGKASDGPTRPPPSHGATPWHVRAGRSADAAPRRRSQLKFSGTDRVRDRLYIRDFMLMQPIPTRLGWLAHHAPLPLHRAALLGMFVAEIPLPFLVFVPGRPRLLAAAGLVALQAGIQAAGNFGWFNVLTAALCLPLLDATASAAEPWWPEDGWPGGGGGGGGAHLLLVHLAAALQLVLGVLHLPFASGLTSAWPFLPATVAWARRAAPPVGGAHKPSPELWPTRAAPPTIHAHAAALRAAGV